MAKVVVKYFFALLAAVLCCCSAGAQTVADTLDVRNMPAAQRHRLGLPDPPEDTVGVRNRQNMEEMTSPVVVADSVAIQADSAAMAKRFWRPDPNKALWYALIFPGAGQIYNRKYWKLPIVYGGFVACTYALTWNNRMYTDYLQAYKDIMDSDPNTNSFKDFLGPGYDLSNQSNIEQLKTIFKNKKNYYRKYRDLSIFAFVGVYALFVIDAYVDAELSDFDISPDLGLRVQPAIINDSKSRNSYGVQFSLTF